VCRKSSGSRVRGAFVPLSVVMGLMLGVSGGLANEGQSSGLAPLVLDWQDAAWGPPTNRPGFPLGIQNAPIATDPETGGPTYLARFPAGSRFEAYWHTYTETVVVLEGTVDIVLDGQRRTADEGSYIIIPGKVHHEWHVPDDADVVLLARRDGPADFHFVEP
jgi:mannose-6-phosphate isomerase-like protein (cupin superfamily)